MRIETARREQIEDLVRLNGVAQALHAEREPGFFHPHDPPAVRAHFESLFGDPTAKFQIAIEEGRAVGYALLRAVSREGNAFTFRRRFVELDQIAVDPGHRRRGPGGALIDAARNFAATECAGWLELSVWRFNAEARRLFARKGLDPCLLRMRSSADGPPGSSL